ncbi:LacI family transcriptional regulator [Paenibacillus doosanensis]|uniref:LacI family DNA-binding transcriptional regulator n=1 Tax=Paenibacillus doosanensis TaxID=1229154 RepID=UPI00217FEF62|nr:LacI family DNA-binding transcriptional regulator [Paenibacillus doosanensis]MCS7462100.1 LacI family transcriptional regulator [Paenibacillus doosanensis]
MATIDDVAKLAGVSKGTVSNVFSKKRPIGPEATKRVFEAARQLGYYPNHIARSLAIRKTMIAGLRMPIPKDGMMSQFEIQMINGVLNECAKHGFRVLLDTLPEHDDPNQFTVDPVDGVIMLNPRREDLRIEMYRQIGMPLVLVGRPDPMDPGVSYVDNDNAELACEVGRYLLSFGHESILFLNASSDMTVAFDRERGLAAALAEQGMPLPPEQVMNYSRELHRSPTEYGYRAVLETMKSRSYTAVVADTDRVALGVLRAARELGLNVPDDLSVIALSNDARLAQEMTPPLTCVELSAEMLGAQAAQILMEKMENANVVRQHTVRAKLVFRESCKKRPR